MAEDKIQRLLQYCKTNDIAIHSSIETKNVPGAGLGVYADKKIRAGEKLIHVPVKQIFTTSKIPISFLSQSAREHIAVHAQLAAFLAFGSKQDLEHYEPWMATWPAFSDFVEGMPIFWSYFADVIQVKLGISTPVSAKSTKGLTDNHLPKRRRISADPAHGNGTNRRRLRSDSTESRIGVPPPFCLSPALCGQYTSSPLDDKSLLQTMINKLTSHVQSIAEALPYLNLIQDNVQLTKFLHAWCLVNTRCFYYVSTPPASDTRKPKPKLKAPIDPNEAMALCPFMDLFNHMAPPPPTNIFTPKPQTPITPQYPCKVKRTPTGFTITTDHPVPANTELLLSYGAHTNDTLWSEYGFLLPSTTNTSDSTPLDPIVLPSLTPLDKSTLESHGYLHTYTLSANGTLCYRTEMAAWLLVLGRAKWIKVVERGLDPEEACTSPTGKAKYTGILTSWLREVRGYATENRTVLDEMGDEEVREQFRTMTVVAAVQAVGEGEGLRVAKARRQMCLRRWEQICAMAEMGLEKLEAEAEV